MPTNSIESIFAAAVLGADLTVGFLITPRY